MKRFAFNAVACLVWALVVSSPLLVAAPAADEQQEKPASPAAKDLDEELLRELGDEPSPVKGKPAGQTDNQPAKRRSPSGEKAKPAEAKGQKASKPTSDPLDEDLLKELEGGDEHRPARSQGGKQPSADGGSGPIGRLTRQMREVQQRLERRESDAETQQLEKKILEELEKLIAQASSQSSSSSSSKNQQQQQGSEREKASQPEPGRQAGQGGKQPNKNPARDSSQRVGKAVKPEKPDLAKLQDLMKDIWGELPPRLRQQMMQSSVEHFVPKYEFEIEEYFKTLAERQQEKP